MTPEEVRALSDEALDEIIQTTVFGGTFPSGFGNLSLSRANPMIVAYTRDWNAMSALSERMRAGGYEVMLLMNHDGHGCLFTGPTTACQHAETLPRAVAEAAVLARAAQHREEMNDAE